MSMYATKDEMIEAMQAEIDSLETQLAEARKDRERLDYLISKSQDGHAFMFETRPAEGKAILISERYRYTSFDVICADTHRTAIDNAMKGGE